MSQAAASDFSAVVELVADVGAEVLGDIQVWEAAERHVLTDRGRRLAWPRPGGNRGYQGLLNLAFEGYVLHVMLSAAVTLEEVPPFDPYDDEFQIILLVAQRAIERLDEVLVQWAKESRLIGPIRGIRDFRNWMRSEEVAEAIACSVRRGERATAIARTGISKSAAYRALGRKPKP